MIPSVFKVTKIGQGTLYVMPKPSSEWLKDDVGYLSNMGISKVVSLLEVSEEYELGLAGERQTLEAKGIEFQNFQIKDRGIPNPVVFKELINRLYKELLEGLNIAVHCRAGIGRTGITASCLLIKDKMTSQEAIDRVSAARGVPIPDTQQQYDFICDYEVI